MLDVLYAGKFLRMVREGRWEFAQRVGGVSAVGIIALTPDRRLIVVEQFRIPVKTSTIELPAGLVGDGMEHEEIEAAAARELLEETGYEAAKWQYLFDGPSSAGMTDEQVHLVLATGLRRVHGGGGVDGEDIVVHEVSLNQLDQFLDSRRSNGLQIDFKVRLAGYYLRCRPDIAG